jgi:hypothetical protein
LLTGLATLLPPGACVLAAPAHSSAGQSGAQRRSCCHPSGDARPCESGRSQQNETSTCCCVRDAGLSKAPDANFDLPLLVSFDLSAPDLALAAGQEPQREAFAPLPPGPRLQTLLCVWRP